MESYEKRIEDVEESQLKKSRQIIDRMKEIQSRQQAGYLWSQFNRVESPTERLKILEEIATMDRKEDILEIVIQRIYAYIQLGAYQTANELLPTGFEIAHDNRRLMYAQSTIAMAMGNLEDARVYVSDSIRLYPDLRDDYLADEEFEPLYEELR